MAGNAAARKVNTRKGKASHAQSTVSDGLQLDDVAVTLFLSHSTVRALSLFGSKKVVDSILDILEVEYSVSINDVARRPKAFESALVSMFGPGSDVMMKILRAEIARDLGVSRDGKSLSELVELARTSHRTDPAEGESELVS